MQQDKSRRKELNDNLAQPSSMGRRALLRSGITAMPAILTLQSGAALARTSNLVSSSPIDTRVGTNTVCLDTNSVPQIGDSGDVYDLGDPPKAEITVIPDLDHHSAQNMSVTTRVDEGVMCVSEETIYHYKDSNDVWQSRQVPSRGIVLSSGAFASIADNVVDPFL
jgi:hypothetical protein